MATNAGLADPPTLLSKTCQNCYHLKIRCDRTQPGSTCDRCQRLGKHCVYRPTRRRYKSAKRDGRIEALESKIEELMKSRANSPTSDATIAPETAPHSRSGSVNGNDSPRSSNGIAGSVQSAASTTDVIDSGFITIDRAEHLLGIYKSNMTPHFPFVVIPPQVNAEQLRQEKPFLFLTILASASFHEMPLQRRLGTLVKQTIGERVVTGETLSFEVLQGLLVFLAWSHYQPRPRCYSQYLQLAISIISDLRLDRSPSATWRSPHVGGNRDPSLKKTTPHEWGSDEQRVVAGCFYLSSTVSKLLQKLNSFPYTQYVEECCVSLCERYEYTTDEHLYYIVRLQHIMENIDSVQLQRSSGAAARAAVLQTKTQLESFSAHLAFDLNDNHMLLMQYRTAELYLCQVAFFRKTAQLDTSLQGELLCKGLSAAKCLLDFYLSLPVYAEMAFNNSEWIQISFTITVASRLAVASTHKSVDHQTRNLRQSLDLGNVIRHLSLRIGSLVTQQVDGQGSRDIFYHFEHRVRRIQSWFERFSTPSRKIRTDSTPQPMQQQQQQQQSQPNPTTQPQSMSPFSQDALGILQPLSHQTPNMPPSSVFPSPEPVQVFQGFSAEPYSWADASGTSTPDVQMIELFPDLDQIFTEWSTPLDNRGMEITA